MMTLKPMGCFSTFSGPFVEWYLLANVASLFPNETLEFDPVTCRITNHERADLALRPPYRDGCQGAETTNGLTTVIPS